MDTTRQSTYKMHIHKNMAQAVCENEKKKKNFNKHGTITSQKSILNEMLTWFHHCQPCFMCSIHVKKNHVDSVCCLLLCSLGILYSIKLKPHVTMSDKYRRLCCFMQVEVIFVPNSE